MNNETGQGTLKSMLMAGALVPTLWQALTASSNWYMMPFTSASGSGLVAKRMSSAKSEQQYSNTNTTLLPCTIGDHVVTGLLKRS